MVVYECTARKAVDPLHRGQMVERGYKVALEPTKYSRHLKICDRLRDSPYWKVSSLTPTAGEPQEVEETPQPFRDHQLEAINRVRALTNNNRS